MPSIKETPSPTGPCAWIPWAWTGIPHYLDRNSGGGGELFPRDAEMIMPALQQYGLGERTARRVRADWQQRGLAEVRPDQDNALCLTVKMDVQTGLDGLDAVVTGLGAQAGLDGNGVVEA